MYIYLTLDIKGGIESNTIILIVRDFNILILSMYRSSKQKPIRKHWP